MVGQLEFRPPNGLAQRQGGRGRLLCILAPLLEKPFCTLRAKPCTLEVVLARNITLRAPTPKCPERFYLVQKGSLPMLKSVVVENPRNK
jgi:hypothetical protein